MLWVAACGAEAPAIPDRVLLVSVDTLRADHLGCYGARRARTPQMDTVAASGVRFEHAISPVPLTLPSHATLLTGLDPPRHGVRHNSIHRLAEGIPTLAEGMRAAGYATGAVVGSLVLDRRFGLARGFDHYDDAMGGRRSGAVGFAERRAGDVVDAALAWLDRAPPRFFLWVHFYDPHVAWDPPPGFAAAFGAHPYAGEIAYVDAQIGRLLEALAVRHGESGLLVAITADHGESLGAHGELTHGYTLYDATQRVPLLLAGAGIPSGVVVASPVRLQDVAPTLLAAVGAAPLAGATGLDLRPLFDASAPAAPPRAAYLETLAPQLDFHWSPLLGLRTDRHKYVRAPRPELYDLRADPAEERNLASERPQLVGALDARLEARIAAARPPTRAGELGAEERALLRRLGYLAPGSEPRALGRVGGPDPKDELGLLVTLAEAQTRLEQGEPGRALEILRPLAQPGASVAALRAAAALSAGEVELAERDARAVLEEEPERSDALVILGRALEAQRRHAEALPAFELASRVDPGSASAHTGRGRCLEALGRAREAARAYTEARRAGDPARAEASWRLAALELEAGRGAAADALLGELDPDALARPEAALRLALAEHAAGRVRAALARLDRALADPSRAGGAREALARIREVLAAAPAGRPGPAGGEGKLLPPSEEKSFPSGAPR